jgi:hypothetical protein
MPRPRARRRVKPDAATARVLGAISRYLHAVGWSAVVVGSVAVQTSVAGRTRHYELVVPFVGTRTTDAPTTPTRRPRR